MHTRVIGAHTCICISVCYMYMYICMLAVNGHMHVHVADTAPDRVVVSGPYSQSVVQTS